MSGTTSVPSFTFGPNGFVAPLESDILAGVQADNNAALGGNLNPSLKTPQGQLAISETAIVGDCNAQFLALANNMDPAFSSGRMQDGIGRIYFLTRNPAQSTVLQVLCNGLPNVPIQVGALVQDQSHNLYACTQAGVIGSDSTVTLPFAAIVTGPIPVPATVSIYRAVSNWDTASVVSGALGNVTESRSDFEFRRQNSVAANSTGMVASVLGAVLNVPNVLDAYAIDNSTNASVTIGGVTIAANSLYVCVAGGTGAAVAQAIWSRKAPGCSYTGNTSLTVQDTNPQYSVPYPTYTVKWQTPVGQAVAIAVTLATNAFVPSTALASIQAAALAAFTGADNNGPRARIGSNLFASRFYAGVAALGPWVQIVEIQIGSNNAADCSFIGSIAANTLTVSTVASGALAVGQFVYGVGVSGGSLITALGSGSGGTGTYTLGSVAQTVASVAMTSVMPNDNFVNFGIGQLPTFNPLDVSLTLVAG